MRKIIIFLIALSLSFCLKAQTFTNVHNYQNVDGLEMAKFFGIPYGSSPSFNGVNPIINGVNFKPPGSLYYNIADSTLYAYTGYNWRPAGGGSGSSVKDTIHVGYGLEVTWDSTGHQLLYADYPDGVIGSCPVTWDSLLTFSTPPCLFSFNQTIYTFPATTLTLDPPNSDPRYDVFYIDTIGPAVKKGDSATVPVVPQLDPGQFALTTGFLINPGDTAANVVNEIVYDELDAGEWANHPQRAAITYDSANTDNRYRGAKDIFVSSYHNLGEIAFVKPLSGTVTPNGQSLVFAFYSNGRFNNDIYIGFYNVATHASNTILLTNSIYGFNRNDSNHYYQISLPLTNSALSWLLPNFTTFVLTMSGSDTSGAKGLYVDYIRLQSGIPNIPNPTDYSNKLDSNTIVKTTVGTDTSNVINWWSKGIAHSLPPIWTGGSGGSTDTTSLSNRINLKLNISDTAAMLAPYATMTAIQTQTLSSGTVTFTSVPATYADYEIFRNGVRNYPVTDYTTSGNVVTIIDGVDGDKIIMQRIK